MKGENELINISDDDDEDGSESDYDSDDSAEVSDGDDDKIKIDSEDSNTNLENTVKTISLTLEGAETSSSNDVNIQDIRNLEEHEVYDETNQEETNGDTSEQSDNVDAVSTEAAPSETNIELTEVNHQDHDQNKLSEDQAKQKDKQK